jgi:acetyl-CoA carboxylase biotin carboxyl carrier protein
MDLKKLKELMTAMNKHSIGRLYIKSEQMEVELETSVSTHFGCSSLCSGCEGEHEKKVDTALTKSVQTKMSSQVKTLAKEHLPENPSGKLVKSPIVGTFYSSPSPGSAAFVKVGDLVKKDTVVCIIEAMKVMNEIKAGVEGRVKEIFPENASPVEYGTPLVCIEV